MWEIKPPNYGLIGHRGAIDLAPENTLEAFIKAKSIGLDMVEFDIRLTSDEQWVVFHDDDTKRLTGQSLITRSSTAEQLSQLRVKKTHPIPLFTALLPQLIELKMRMNIELKTEAIDREIALREFLPVIRDWPSHAPAPLVSSFDHELIKALRAACPALHLGLLTHDNEADLFRQAKALGKCAVHFDAAKARPNDLKESKLSNIPLLYFTVNDHRQIKQLKSEGVWGVFTDKAASIIDEL